MFLYGLRTITFACAGLGILMALGCQPSGPELATVTGKITLDGKPMYGVVVTFTAEGGSASYGVTDTQGVYTLMFTDTKAGAMVGTNQVTLESPRVSPSELEELKAQGQEIPAEVAPVPRKYSATGALTAEVESGKNTIDFELTSK